MDDPVTVNPFPFLDQEIDRAVDELAEAEIEAAFRRGVIDGLRRARLRLELVLRAHAAPEAPYVPPFDPGPADPADADAEPVDDGDGPAGAPATADPGDGGPPAWRSMADSVAAGE